MPESKKLPNSELAFAETERYEKDTSEYDHGIIDDQAIFEAYLDNCDPKLFGPSLAKGNDFSTFWDNDGWGNG